MMEAQQFGPSNYTGIIPDNQVGAFGYVHVDMFDECYPGGVVGESVELVCDAIPEFCITYNSGLFNGETFLIADQHPDYDFYDGGIAFDQGWVGVALIEGAIQQENLITKERFKNAATLAANWAVNEPPVRNHNYTAKLIWLLAEMYAWSGDETYKTALNHKLDKNLIPGILMDLDENGAVDGMEPDILFTDLSPIAQRPGRMWDGHNALPWYNAMNTWAMVEAYVAFRDRGETERATELKPYAIAMLDNLAWEVNHLGIIPDQLGVRALTYGLLTAIWKISQYEGETHPTWESAVWGLWNSGYFNELSTHSVCVGLYLLIKTETAYTPLAEREDFASLHNQEANNTIHIYPNPGQGLVHIELNNNTQNISKIQLINLQGQVIFEKELLSNIVDMSTVQSGTYFIQFLDDDRKRMYSEKFVLQ